MRKYIGYVLYVCALLVTSAMPCPASVTDDLYLAKSLYERGLYERAEAMFSELAAKTGSAEAEGWGVMCAIRLKRVGSDAAMESFMWKHPHSAIIPQMRYAYAMNLFDAERYADAGKVLESIPVRKIWRSQFDEFLFKRAWCDFEAGNYSRASSRFKTISQRDYTDYTAPSRYTLGYICYIGRNFAEAEGWFREAAGDHRFAEISNYYILECRFMQKDYAYVTKNGPGMIESVPEDRKSQLARIVSESFLVTGDVQKAKEFFALEEFTDEKPMTRSDYFHAGSVLYAAKDWEGAVKNFSAMEERTDSIGQVASYQMAHCYLQMRNKVAAMDCFKEASAVSYDGNIAEDSYYNYAKLAFDLNSDASVFKSFLSKYPDNGRNDEIYSYIGLSALREKDYAGAVEAYGKVGKKAGEVQWNYMKANYLRAAELVAGGSWSGAVPYLETVARGLDVRNETGCLARYWLAESYFRAGRYSDAENIFVSLLKANAFMETDEFGLLTYNIAFCHFRREDYKSADTWLTRYVETPSPIFRREALVRRGDCRFMQRSYADAAVSYEEAMNYGGLSDVYPHYQAAVSYGLLGNSVRKIEILSMAAEADADAAFYPEAVYELGRTYAREGLRAMAVDTFKGMVEHVKDTTYVALALMELGALAQTAGNNAEALDYYRRIVERMPSAGSAGDALAAIESIYTADNNPQGYLAYLDRVGKSSVKTDADREQMIFNAAEQVYLSGNRQKAMSAMMSYLEDYPDGLYAVPAEFYLAESLRETGDRENAVAHYGVVKEYGGFFREVSLLRWAELSFELQRYEDALEGYRELAATAEIDGNAGVARVGAMRSAYAGKMYEEAAEAADAVLSGGDGVAVEAEYVKAKSLLALSRRDEAMEIVTRLAADPKSVYGAEAAFLLIRDSYDRGDFDRTEQLVYDFSDSGTPQRYWLARAFILLGDSFAERDDFAQAKATFNSILDSYSVEDDGVRDDVRFRINRLNEMSEYGL